VTRPVLLLLMLVLLLVLLLVMYRQCWWVEEWAEMSHCWSCLCLCLCVWKLSDNHRVYMATAAIWVGNECAQRRDCWG
jgi:hypothetical protein